MKNIWILIVAAIVVIGGGFYWWQSSHAPAPLSDDGTSVAVDAADDAAANQAPATTTEPAVSIGADVNASTAPASATVTYNGSSFSPASVTVKLGAVVTFTSTAGNMWVASAPHPAHTGYDGTSRATHCAAGYTGAAPFDQCSAGTSYTFTFDKVGTWPYHNHLDSGSHGTIVVVQ